MMETLVEELTVDEIIGEIIGALVTAMKKKLFYCYCCSWMKWRRGADEGDVQLLVQEANVGEGKNDGEMVWW